MSTLQATNIKNASSATTNLALDTAGNATVGNALIMGSGSFLRNRIINGDARIDQRYVGVAITGITTTPIYIVDRFYTYMASGATVTAQQSTVAPAGFRNSIYCTVTSAGSPSYGFIQQSIEGYNVGDLLMGTASAQSVTVSFWVRSSQTGIYTVSIQSSTYDYSYNATYTINTANTWQYVSVTIPGTALGTWYSDNRTGMNVRFCLCPNASAANSWVSGSYNGASTAVNWYANAGATFYITGVQLEAGSAATPFERRQFTHELALCQRYYCKTFPLYVAPASGADGSNAWGLSTQAASGNGWFGDVTWTFPVTMRAMPTVYLYNPVLSGGTFTKNVANEQRPVRYLGHNSLNKVSIGSTNIVNSGEYLLIHAAAEAEL